MSDATVAAPVVADAAAATETAADGTSPVKRKREDDGAGSVAKVAAAAATPEFTLPSETPIPTIQGGSAVLHCPQNVVGRVIGRGGETINNLQNKTGCHIQIDQKVPVGQPRVVTITGPPANVAFAASLVKELIDGTTHSSPGVGGETLTVDVPADLVGRVIGRGGETIKSLQNMSGCHINIDQNFPAGHPRKVTISGTKQQINIAHEQLLAVMRDGPNAAVAQTAGTFNQTIEVDSTLVGRLIGRGGETINDMQTRSKCRIQIDQSMPDGVPRKVTISAISPERVAHGVAIVQECMQDGPRTIGGAASSFGMQSSAAAMGGAAAYGAYGAVQRPGFGGMMPQMGAYGMQPAAAYGQPAYGAGFRAPAYGAGFQAPVPQAPHAQSPWTEHRTDEGKPYWYNSVTNVSVWERPR